MSVSTLSGSQLFNIVQYKALNKGQIVTAVTLKKEYVKIENAVHKDLKNKYFVCILSGQSSKIRT